tara:strand:+ start:313 stop:1308 length:996 start_codon:yes stop_codon:yes gene_type:complete
MVKTFIIAEAGINHNGKLSIAKKLANKAKQVGANAIKFQIYIAEDLATKKAKKVGYQKKNDKNKNMLEMLKKNQLSFDDFKKLKKHCDKKKIEFISSAFDEKSLKFLKSLKPNYYKIPSGEITNYPNLKLISKFNKKLLISTGMSNLHEIKKIINLITKFGISKKRIVLLQCNSSYPTNVYNANLNVIKTFKKKFNVKVGYSDHTEDLEAPAIAVALGAEFIEKHFTLNKFMKGPDHFFSLTPSEFKKMVINIRKTEKLLGSNKKFVLKGEKLNRRLSRKSIVAKKSIKKGEKFSLKNLTTKRPWDGVSALNWTRILKKRAKKNYQENEKI